MEWNGAWSDNAKDWTDPIKKLLRYDNCDPNDGIFWIAFPDF